MDDRGVRALLAAAILKTIQDAAKPAPPRLCTRQEWELARLLVHEWEAEYGKRLVQRKASESETREEA